MTGGTSYARNPPRRGPFKKGLLRRVPPAYSGPIQIAFLDDAARTYFEVPSLDRIGNRI